MYPFQIVNTTYHCTSNLKRIDGQASSSHEALEPLRVSVLTIAWFYRKEMKPVQRHKREMIQNKMSSKQSLFSSIQPFVLNQTQWAYPCIVPCLRVGFLVDRRTVTRILSWWSVPALIMSVRRWKVLEWNGPICGLRILHSLAGVQRSLFFRAISMGMRCNRTVMCWIHSEFKTSMIFTCCSFVKCKKDPFSSVILLTPSHNCFWRYASVLSMNLLFNCISSSISVLRWWRASRAWWR